MASNEVTIDLSTRDSNSKAESVSRAEPVVTRGRMRLSAETQALLRSRLATTSILLALAFGFFFVLRLVLPNRDLVIASLHAATWLVLALAAGVLSSRRPLSLKQLRAIELTVFGLTITFFAAVEYRLILFHSRRGDLVMAVATVKNAVIYTYSVVTLYGVFIPNTWRRAASVIVPMVVAPLLAWGLVYALHPEVHELMRGASTLELVSENLLMLLLSGVTAVYGTRIIHTLRTEAFSARRLGQYRLGERLGGGGMGEVFLAEHQLLKRPCAIKLIRPDRAANSKALARFEREVRSTARLSHWNTVQIYDYGRTEDGTFYYAMEYLRGLNLADLVERYGPMPAERVICLLIQACEALREAHAAGLIHRDIKPANIFAAEQGGRYDVTKLLDFGLVKATAETRSIELSQEGTIAGSPLYMAPEQASGSSPPDHRSDIYSLGAVAYYLLTGSPPFKRDTVLDVLISHARDEPVPPSTLQADVPADLERVVLRCLAKSPSDRYQDAESFERDLAACAAAGLWTQERAAQWWRSVPARFVPPVATPDLVETVDRPLSPRGADGGLGPA